MCRTRSQDQTASSSAVVPRAGVTPQPEPALRALAAVLWEIAGNQQLAHENAAGCEPAAEGGQLASAKRPPP